MVHLVIEGLDLGPFVDDVIAGVRASGSDGDEAIAAAQRRIDELDRTRATPLSGPQKNSVLRIALRQAALIIPDPDRYKIPDSDRYKTELLPTPPGGFTVPRSEWNWAGQPLPPDATPGRSASGRSAPSSGGQAWRRLEHTIAGIMRGTVRSGSHDGGIDVESGSAVAQVKRQAATVGAPVVQQLYGAAQAAQKSGEFYTTSSYSRDAIAFARRVGVKLYVVDEVSGSAQRVD